MAAVATASLARRTDRLGTENAFTAAAEANAFAAQGHRVYPFHLGDLNLPTPENIVEATCKAMRDGKTMYCPNAGLPELRDVLAAQVGEARGLSYGADNVAVQPGGKPVIGKFLMAMMNSGDEVLYPNPGFPIYSSLIGYLGGTAVPYTLHQGANGFAIDLDGLERSISARTRLLILNDLHNPTGAECTPAELQRLAELVLEHDLQVLCDEAYFDVRLDGGRSRSLASLPGMQSRCVILFTFSKKYAMTGWRLGAAIGPEAVIDVIVKLNTNLESCTNQFVQWGGLEALTGDQRGAHYITTVLRERRDVAADILDSTAGVTCLRPNTTFYLYPDVTGAMQRKGLTDYEAFRRVVLRETGVSMCTRAHFGPALDAETRYYLRVAYGGIGTSEIEEGLKRLKTFLES